MKVKLTLLVKVSGRQHYLIIPRDSMEAYVNTQDPMESSMASHAWCSTDQCGTP